MKVPLSAVELVVATHWHDDHVRGLSDVLAQTEQASFACSAALRTEEFQNAVASAPTRSRAAKHGSGLDEMAAIFAILQQRKETPIWLLENQTVWTGMNAIVTALSPSSATFSRALKGISNLAPKLRANVRMFASVEPNETSVALQVRVGDAIALLGADLENTTAHDRGWNAIVNSQRRPPGKGQVFKVAHHGSISGHHAGIWSELLSPLPIAVLTPFTRSRLPTETDLERTKQIASCVLLTSRRVTQPLKREASVTRTITEVAKRVPLPLRGRMGHVRLRLSNQTGDVLSADLFGAAERV